MDRVREYLCAWALRGLQMETLSSLSIVFTIFRTALWGDADVLGPSGYGGSEWT